MSDRQRRVPRVSDRSFLVGASATPSRWIAGAVLERRNRQCESGALKLPLPPTEFCSHGRLKLRTKQALNLGAIRERLIAINALPRDGDFHLPEFPIRRDPIHRLPARFPPRPRVAHGRLEHHIVFRPGGIAEILKENLLSTRARGIDVQPDFVAVVKDGFGVVAPTWRLA